MLQSAAALNAAYPRDLPIPELFEHIEDLLQRFQNRALGDTIYRVGRDLPRKLDKEDRLIGAMLLAKQTSCACDLIAQAVLAACEFRARDEQGRLFPADQHFLEQDSPAGIEHILITVCRLSPALPLEHAVIKEIVHQASSLKSQKCPHRSQTTTIKDNKHSLPSWSEPGVTMIHRGYICSRHVSFKSEAHRGPLFLLTGLYPIALRIFQLITGKWQRQTLPELSYFCALKLHDALNTNQVCFLHTFRALIA
jgi:hypothetical protein